MKYLLIAIISFVVFIFSLYKYLVTSRERFPKEVTVEDVTDGDTIRVTGGHTVRYIGINAPEIGRKEGGRWIYDPEPFAEEAKALNEELIDGRKVRLEYDVVKRDNFGRLLAYVYVGDNLVNGRMISRGYALTYIYPPNLKHANLLVRLQKEAKENDRGFWTEVKSHPILPDKAVEYIGRIKVVEGKVQDIYIGAKVILLNFGSGYKSDFHITIFRNMANRFESQGVSPDRYYKKKKIRAWGLIKGFEGRPEMVIDDPSQIEVLE